MPNATEPTLHDTILGLEQSMWQAFTCGDSQAFARLVDPRALMIVGGGRTSGAAYAQAISAVHLQSFELLDVSVLDLGSQAAAIHYTVNIVDHPGPYDLSGTYRVSSVWQRQGSGWKLVLNHDSVAAQELP